MDFTDCKMDFTDCKMDFTDCIIWAGTFGLYVACLLWLGSIYPDELNRKYRGLKHKMTTLKTDYETLQVSVDFQDTMTMEQNTMVRKQIDSLNASVELSQHTDIELIEKTKLELSNLYENMYSTIEQVNKRLTEVENIYDYGKCVFHKTRGYGRITSATFKVEGCLLVYFVYPQDGSTRKVHVKYSDIKIVPKTIYWNPQDIFRIKRGTDEIIGMGLGFGKCDKLGMIPSAYAVGIVTYIHMDYVIKPGTIPSTICLSDLSVLSDPEIESPCIVDNTECTIIRIRTFCPQLNAYTT
jgi:hypothetical protein